MQPSQARAGLRDRRLTFPVTRDVGAGGDEAAVLRRLLERGRKSVESLFVDVERGYLRAGIEHSAHQLPSEPFGRTGDDGDLAVELYIQMHPLTTS